MQKPKDRLKQQKPGAKPVPRAPAGRNSVQLFGPRNPARPNTHVQNPVRMLPRNAAAPARNSTPVRPEARAINPRPTPPAKVVNRPQAPAPSAPSPRAGQQSIQRFSSRVILGVKLFPNLHPGAVEAVNPSNIFRLNSFAGQYRLHQVHNHGVN